MAACCQNASTFRTMSEEVIASLLVQRLLVCLPLLQRTGKLALLGFGLSPSDLTQRSAEPDAIAPVVEIDHSASAAIAELGASDFL